MRYIKPDKVRIIQLAPIMENTELGQAVVPCVNPTIYGLGDDGICYYLDSVKERKDLPEPDEDGERRILYREHPIWYVVNRYDSKEYLKDQGLTE